MKLNPNGSKQCRVGIKGLADNIHGTSLINQALSPTMACLHETFGHCGQWDNEAQKNTNLSKILILTDRACCNSWYYYGRDWDGQFTRDYYNKPHEIAAQYMAYKTGYKLLSAVFGEEKADELLTEVVNLRMAGNDEYIEDPDWYRDKRPKIMRTDLWKITEPFSCMDEVFDQFQTAMDRSILGPLEYNVPKESMDPISKYINGLDSSLKKMWARMTINHASDKITQAYVLAGKWLEYNEEFLWIKDLPVFEDMEFSNSPIKIIKNSPNHLTQNDTDLTQLTEPDVDYHEIADGFKEAVEEIKPSDILNL